MMNDKDLEKLMKQSVRKQVSKVVLWSTLIVLLILGSGGLIYAHKYNYWPLNEWKISGIPDDTLVRIESGDEVVYLGPEEGVKFNANANQVVVTMDYYQKDKKVDSTELFTISAKDSTTQTISGAIRWKQNDWGDTLDNLKVGASVSGIQKEEVYSIRTKTPLKDGESFGSTYSGVGYYSQKIVKGRPYVFGSWGFGKDSVTSLLAEDGIINKNDLATNEESYVLILTFK